MPELLESIPCAIITVSDRCAAGEREDASGPLLAQGFADEGASVTSAIVPDGAASVEGAIRAAVAGGARVVITTGGTGVAVHDRTPEGTRAAIDFDVPGIAELLRRSDPSDPEPKPGAALSRGIAGVVAGPPPALIVNVAGSPGAAATAARVLPPVVAHALAQLDGSDH